MGSDLFRQHILASPSWEKISYGYMEALALETSSLFERAVDAVWKFR
jgi:hypothetical protein